MAGLPRDSYEASLDRMERKSRGVFYTPAYLTRFIVREVLDRLLADSPVAVAGPTLEPELKILDPACGTGAFLQPALEYLQNIYNESGSEQSGLEIVRQHLYGTDLDPQAVQLAGRALARSAGWSGAGEAPELNLSSVNALLANPWPELRFDAIITNPPWGADCLDPEGQIRSKFSSRARGNYDSFKLFVFRIMELLKEGGLAGLVLPNTLLTQQRFEDLRKCLATENTLEIIIDLGEKIFQQVTVPACVVIFRRRRPPEETRVKVLDLKQLRDDPARAAALIQPVYDEVQVRDIQNGPRYNFYNWSNQQERHLFWRLLEIGRQKPLAALVAHLIQGIKTGGNEVFIINQQLAEQWDMEPELLQPVIKGADIEPGRLNRRDRLLLALWPGVDLDSYPQAKAYLEKYRFKYPILENRNPVRTGRRQWWEISEPRQPVVFAAGRIVLRQTADRLVAAAVAEDGLLATNDVYNLTFAAGVEPKPLSYLTALLNSGLLNWFYCNLTAERGRTFAEVKRVNLELLPVIIPPPGKQAEISAAFQASLASPLLARQKFEQLILDLYDLGADDQALIMKAGCV